MSRVQTVYATNEDAVEIATYCVGSADAQAALWIAHAENEERRTGALTALAEERYRLEKGMPGESIKSEALRRISDRPDVRAAYERLARDLPEPYRPALVDFAGLGLSGQVPVAEHNSAPLAGPGAGEQADPNRAQVTSGAR